MTAQVNISDTVASGYSPAKREWPVVSVVMPVRNEFGFVAKCLEQVLTQDYPSDRLEIVVADGMSTDGTREILADFSRRFSQVTILDNPGKIVSTGLNAAIAQAKGEIILRLDGHAEVASDFVRQNVLLLEEHPDAWSVGGPIRHAGTNVFGKAVSIAMSHPCGVGNARHRFPNYEGYVEGAQFPAIHRWVFGEVGNFDEQLVRNQDDEFNFRMTEAGGKIFISPRVRYEYFVRDSIRKLARQYFQYSFWRIPVVRKHRRPTTFRQLIPPIFFSAVFVLFAVGSAIKNPYIAFTLPVAYFAGLILVMLSVLPKFGLKVATLVPVAVFVMHLSYAFGWLYGAWAIIFRPRAWDTQGNMAKLSR